MPYWVCGKNIARQILEILVYLHSSTPPVIHRDIKPQNIIRQPDGRVYLVDFGSVQAAYRNTISIGGTFVGTLGYMSPEQLRGKIVPAADLYSLGCSLLFLLTHRSPHELPQRGMGIDFSSIVNISSIFTEWLARIIEPIVEDRFQSAQDALQALSNKSININNPILLPANLSNQTSKYLQKKRYEIGREHESLGTHLKPKLSNLVIHKKDDRVLIKILLKRRGIIINLSTAIIVNLKKYIVKTSRNIEYIEFYDIHSDYGDLLIIVNAFILLINIFIPILVFISKPLLIVLLIIVLANGVLNFSLSMINEINTIFGQYESILNISSCILLILVIVVIDLLWIIFNYLYCYYYLEINNKKINMVQKCLFFTI